MQNFMCNVFDLMCEHSHAASMGHATPEISAGPIALLAIVLAIGGCLSLMGE